MKLLCEYQGDYFVSEPFLIELNGSYKIMVCQDKRKAIINIDDLDGMAEIVSIGFTTIINTASVIITLKPFLDKNDNKVEIGNVIGSILIPYQPAIYKVIDMDLHHVCLCRIYDGKECYVVCPRIPRESIAKHWTKIS